MSIPAHLAVNVRPEDYHWHRLEPLPAKPAPAATQETQTVQEPLTRIEQVPSPVVAETISADEFVKRIDAYYDKILKIPDCHAQLLAKAAAAKLDKREQRRRRKASREKAA